MSDNNGSTPGISPGRATAKPPAAIRPRRIRWVLPTLVFGYAALIVAFWACMYAEGDREWVATLILYGPRWLCALPLPLLALAAAVRRWRLLLVLAVTGLVILGPIMGFRAHLPARAGTPPSLRVLTCNAHYDVHCRETLKELIAREQPDIVAVQETNPWPDFDLGPSWHVLRRDEYFVASRWPIVESGSVLRPHVPGKLCAVRFTVQRPEQELQLITVHLETPRVGMTTLLSPDGDVDLTGIEDLDLMDRLRAIESKRVSDWIAGLPGTKIVLGDFNMPVESTIYRQDWSQLGNAFSTAGWGFGFTKITKLLRWTYGTRIDQVLFSGEFRPLRSWVGADVGSDHLPLLAEFE